MSSSYPVSLVSCSLSPSLPLSLSLLQQAGMAFNRALQKLATTLKTKPNATGDAMSKGETFVEKLKYVYDKYDPDNDGLDISEFQEAMEKEGIDDLPPEMIENVFLILDPDQDGTVTLDEFNYAYFNRRKLQYAAGGEAVRLEAQKKLRDKRRKAAIKKLMVDKFKREREACLPPEDPTRDNVDILEREMSINGHKAEGVKVNKNFNPDATEVEEKVAWAFWEQDVPLMGITEGEIVLVVKKGVGRDRRWCVGMSADRSTWGFFPMWCVDHMTSFLKLHDETKLLQERQKKRDAEREAKQRKIEADELALCSFSPSVTAKAKEMGAKKSEVVVSAFNGIKDRVLLQKGFAKDKGPPAPPLALNVGDRVEVIDRRIGINGRWCLGRLPRKNDRSQAARGVFPRWCIGENSHFNRMHEEGHRIEERRHAKRAELKMKDDDEFTFHPKTNRRKNLKMLKGYEERREEREQKRLDKHIDHLFKECTFKPKLLKTANIISSSAPRAENSYMRKKEKSFEMPPPTLNTQGRLSSPAHAYIVKPFQWNRDGAVSQMLVPAFGKKHPKPVSCFIKDKVLVLDTMCGRDHRWCLIKLGRDTGVCPMWVLPKNFQPKLKRKTKPQYDGTMDDDELDLSPLGGGAGGFGGGRQSIMRSPVPPGERSGGQTKTSPIARRKKRPHNDGGGRGSPSERPQGRGGDRGGGVRGGGGENNNTSPTIEPRAEVPRRKVPQKLSQKQELAREIPGLFRNIKKSLKDRASTLQKAFLMLDTNHNNVVNRHEFKAWLRKFGLVKLPKTESSEQLMDMLFERMDVDRDGQITFAEFAKKLNTVK